MYRGKTIIIVTPAGRRRYLEILLPYVLREREIIDQYRFWVNTCDEEDIAYISKIVDGDSEFFAADYLEDPHPDWRGNRRVRLIREFFPGCTEVNTVYIRLDDDICWMAEGALKTLIDFRIDHPEFFLVYPCLFNNGYTAKIHSEMNLIQVANVDAFRKWQREPAVGAMHHQKLLEAIETNTLSKWEFGANIIHDYVQAPINCISWLGEEFKSFGGIVADEECDFLEEVWLTKIKPKQLQKPNCMYGRSMMSHFAFNTQREYLEGQTTLLEIYEIMSMYGGRLSDL